MPSRLPLRLNASPLLIGLGLVLILTALAASLLTAPPAAEPLDPADAALLATEGFEPLLVPAGGPEQLGAAPTLPPVDLVSALAASATPSAAPTSAAPTPTGPATRVTPTPTATPEPLWIPDRLVIPAIELDVPVVAAGLTAVTVDGQLYQEWVAPDEKAAGWHTSSAPLGVIGNTVLNGHHNVHGEVFGHLVDLKEGDLIYVYSGERTFIYRIRLITILKERWQPLAVRLVNARWIGPSHDERLTLVTCWPYTSNTHRLIIVGTRVDPSAVAAATLIPRLTPHPPPAP